MPCFIIECSDQPIMNLFAIEILKLDLVNGD